jgi:hypothetical protein
MMHSLRYLSIAAVAAAMLAIGTPASAVAADSFGRHVAMCAHELGQRADAPAATCTHDGMTMTFVNFGSMVKHMREMH